MLNQAAAYAPTFLFGLFPTDVAVEPGDSGMTAPDYSISNFDSYTYTSTASLRHDFSHRSNFVFYGDFQYTDRLHENVRWRDVSSHSMRAQYSRNISRTTALNAQYRYRSGDFGYGGDGITTESGVDFGITNTRPLSATRHASFRFNLGASAAEVPVTTLEGRIYQRQYLILADAGFEYQFNRVWQSRGNYRRGLQYAPGIPQPVLGGSYGVEVDGVFGRRVDLLLFAGYSSGQALLNPNELVFDTYTSDARLRYALTRHVAAYIEYLYYYYNFHEGGRLLAEIPRGLERNGIRAGLTFWMPAFRK